ncbi:Indole-3-glycerol phosphate synthase [bioreactor metagenome]|uniref:indole-3-glycerol-phosphate synthase n=1 Tax=bioreactor metagenome TaxID=1076179 RepID=A0A645ARK0_9ZZZZ
MILDELAAHAKERVLTAEKRISLSEIKSYALSLPESNFYFEESLKENGLSFICEVKKASPSKGIIDSQFDYLKIAAEYEAAGADCLSCLTEPKWFLGSDEIFRAIRQTTFLPMLRKDFTVHEYQLYEAKCMGANAVLLICALLNTQTIAQYLDICHQLGLSALVETHSDAEISSAIDAGARIIGVNNRNLKDFTVDISNSARLRELVPPNVLFVAESGIQKPEDVTPLYQFGVNAVLIGESMMRTDDKKALLRAFREAAK